MCVGQWCWGVFRVVGRAGHGWKGAVALHHAACMRGAAVLPLVLLAGLLPSPGLSATRACPGGKWWEQSSDAWSRCHAVMGERGA